MAAPEHTRGFIGKSIRWIREISGERALTPRFTNAQILEFLAAALEEVTSDVYRMADGPPKAEFKFTLEADRDLYPLPANMLEFHSLERLDTTTGFPLWSYNPKVTTAPSRVGVVIEEKFLRFKPVPCSGDAGTELTLRYLPGKRTAFHQSISPVFSGAADTGDAYFSNDSAFATGDEDYTGNATIQLNPTEYATPYNWFLGIFDHRPEAFIGERIRVLGTHNDYAPDAVSAYTYFPLMEATITDYNIIDRIATVLPAWLLDSDDLAGIDAIDPTAMQKSITHVIYEVVPNLDDGVWWLACIRAAQDICATCNRQTKVTRLREMYVEKLRSARLDWANRNMRSGDKFDPIEPDWADDVSMI